MTHAALSAAVDGQGPGASAGGRPSSTGIGQTAALSGELPQRAVFPAAASLQQHPVSGVKDDEPLAGSAATLRVEAGAPSALTDDRALVPESSPWRRGTPIARLWPARA